MVALIMLTAAAVWGGVCALRPAPPRTPGRRHAACVHRLQQIFLKIFFQKIKIKIINFDKRITRTVSQVFRKKKKEKKTFSVEMPIMRREKPLKFAPVYNKGAVPLDGENLEA